MFDAAKLGFNVLEEARHLPPNDSNSAIGTKSMVVIEDLKETLIMLFGSVDGGSDASWTGIDADAAWAHVDKMTSWFPLRDAAMLDMQEFLVQFPSLVRAAAADPDGFRLLFRYAAREPEFRDMVEALSASSAEVAHRNLTLLLPDGPWTRWAASLLPTLTTEAVIAWLDAGRPDPGQAADRIGQAVAGVIEAARG